MSQDAPLACPACGAGHEAAERFCRDCGLPLVLGPGAASPPKRSGELADRARKVRPQYAEGALVRVARARHQAEAELVQGLLLEEGIPSLARRSGGFDVPDFLASGPRDVLVPASGAEAAREALALTGPADVPPRARPAGEGTPPWVRAMAVALAVLVLAVVAAGLIAALTA